MASMPAFNAGGRKRGLSVFEVGVWRAWHGRTRELTETIQSLRHRAPRSGKPRGSPLASGEFREGAVGDGAGMKPAPCPKGVRGRDVAGLVEFVASISVGTMMAESEMDGRDQPGEVGAEASMSPCRRVPRPCSTELPAHEHAVGHVATRQARAAAEDWNSMGRSFHCFIAAIWRSRRRNKPGTWRTLRDCIPSSALRSLPSQPMPIPVMLVYLMVLPRPGTFISPSNSDTLPHKPPHDTSEQPVLRLHHP